ncbi:hypothetical protein NECAME_12348 [Necator americanus]|uniref:Uncharacterized protein n=1 Tax=Necator americanus TaxID=51031 RepID=W2T2L8_NECAM|nr:hypothetical protein NECAME_12348 [Necator americanus]ETN75481.1 hypothetical protein NECAME_12348 [Necator americanus]
MNRNTVDTETDITFLLNVFPQWQQQLLCSTTGTGTHTTAMVLSHLRIARGQHAEGRARTRFRSTSYLSGDTNRFLDVNKCVFMSVCQCSLE